jgi:phage tail-like protein
MLEYLPSIYQTETRFEGTFLKQFLAAFEKVLLGLNDRDHSFVDEDDESSYEDIVPLGEEVSRLHLFLDPRETPEEFLPWLANWAALGFREELSAPRKRKLLSHAIPLYRLRGTKKYLEEMLALCVDAVVTVSDTELPAMQIGTHSTVGDDTCLGGGVPHFFAVRLLVPRLGVDELERQKRIAHEVVQLSKPAHTDYELQDDAPRMQVGVHSSVGYDTVLGAAAG